MAVPVITKEGAARQREEAQRVCDRMQAEGFRANVHKLHDGSYACVVWSPLREGETEAR